MDAWLENLTDDEIKDVEDRLPEPYRALLTEVTPRQMIAIGKLLAGLTYIADPKDALIVARNEKIRERFNGSNYDELAFQFKLSERRIREIVDQNGSKK